MKMKKIAVALLASVLAASSAAADGSKPDKKAILQQHELTQANKALVLKAYQELFGDHDLTALDRYWAANYIQRNPTMTDGRDSVRQLLEKMGITHWPKQKVEFKRVIAEGDLVMTEVVQPKTDATPETAIVDMFRVENGKIAEHWDVIQAVPTDAVNKRSMY
ncbi:nuclear transport factor 2 family protein [Mesorhizobium erdmanii]|uniref:nuclear transport factor 2 family protein n=1 Tax=Mesorhizobium erdmanii TaxID=1777866 RepID=UPI0003FA7A09|nr:nuclear transport factor 2 family protein [Mesorhizobium erdmanii]